MLAAVTYLAASAATALVHRVTPQVSPGPWAAGLAHLGLSAVSDIRALLLTDVALGAKPVELEGLAKPLAARVMSAALGGQKLLTADARAALGTTTHHIESHGHWRMKGWPS